MAERHALFMVREGLLVRQAGPREWKPILPSTEATVKAIAAGGREKPAPYVYDVDGVEARAAQFSFYQRLEQSHAVPWIHSGCRTPEDAMDTFFAGAEAVTIELRHMDESVFEELAGLAEGEIHLGVALTKDMPRPREVARIVQAHGLAGVVIQADEGADLRRLESLLPDFRSLGTSTTLLLFGDQRVDARLEPLVDRVVGFPPGVA